MNTTQLECFVAVAEHLNFSRASEELKMTQPAVSHQIRTLEEELGVKLFMRTSKNVSLTSDPWKQSWKPFCSNARARASRSRRRGSFSSQTHSSS